MQLAVADWPAIRQRALDIAAEIEDAPAPVPANEAREVKALIEWMTDNHFTFLGYREYRLQRGRTEDVLEPLPETGLGILRARRGARVQPTALTGALREHAREVELLTVTKANSISTVHRATYLDYIGLKTFDKSGRVSGERRFLGLFTSSVYNRSPREIPLLRHKIERVVDHFGLDPASHDAKAVVHVLETYPRDELFQANVGELIRIVRGVVNLYERQRVRVFLRRDAFGRFYSAMIYVPRDRYNTQVREKMETVVSTALNATAVESQVQLSESALARVHMIIRVPAGVTPRIDAEPLERLIADAVRTWNDRLRDALIAERGEIEGRAVADRYSNAFSAAYEEDSDASAAIKDIRQLDEVLADPDRIALRLAPGEGATIHLRLSRSAAPIPLSQALPVLENMGFVILSERPYRITAPGEREIWLQDFQMQRRDGAPVDPAGAESTVHRHVQRRMERPRRERRLQSSRRRHEYGLASGERSASVLPLHPADERDLQSVVHGAGARLKCCDRGGAVAALRGAVRPRAGAGGSQDRSCAHAKGARASARRGEESGRRPDSAPFRRRHSGDAAHQLLPERRERRREAVHRLQARPTQHSGTAAAAAGV